MRNVGTGCVGLMTHLWRTPDIGGQITNKNGINSFVRVWPGFRANNRQTVSNPFLGLGKSRRQSRQNPISGLSNVSRHRSDRANLTSAVTERLSGENRLGLRPVVITTAGKMAESQLRLISEVASWDRSRTSPNHPDSQCEASTRIECRRR